MKKKRFRYYLIQLISNFKKIVESKYTPSLLFLVTVIITMIAWKISDYSIQKRSKDQFESRVQDIQLQIVKRMQEYELILRGGVGLFLMSESVSRKEWKNYFDNLDLPKFYPGIQGVGFSKVIYPDQLKSHIYQIRTEGFKDYSLYPEGQRDIYTSIIFLEPFEGRNLRAFGYDMYSEPIRREAMERARDTGELSISGVVKLVQETGVDPQNGFLMYLPVYQNNSSTMDREHRRSSLLGYVYSPFRINDLMNGILGANIHDVSFELVDATNDQSQTTMFQSIKHDINHDNFNKEVQFFMGGRVWLLRVHTEPQFLSQQENAFPLFIAIIGIILNFTLFYMTRLMSKRHREIGVLVAQKTQELSESRERLQLAIEGSQDGIWDWNIKTNEVYFSSKWKGMLGYNESEVANDFNGWMELIHRDDKEKALNTIENYLCGSSSEYALEHRLRHKNGSYRWILARGVSLRDSSGKPTRMAGSHKDITEQKKVEKMLIQAKDQAVSEMSLKSMFLATMSHEIRTPLNSIIGMSDLLSKTEQTETQREYIEAILRSSCHLNAIVTDILDLSKIESKKIKLEQEEIDLNDLLQGLHKELVYLADQRDIKFEIDLLVESVKFQGDYVRLRQVLINLIQNAIKFTNKGGVKLRGYFSKGPRKKGRIRFEVEDTGIGIEENDLKKIFTPFERLNPISSRNDDGTGLGLSICKNLVDLMGGQIGVHSKKGVGSIFFIEIPTAIEGSDRFYSTPFDYKENQEMIPKRVLKILVAEDNIANQKVVCRILENFGHDVHFVFNGKEVLSLLDSENFDLILMDCHMPEFDGFLTAAEIRKHDSPISKIPIIALTADVLSSTRQKCESCGMNGFLGKPFDSKSLFEEIEKVLDSNDLSKVQSNVQSNVEIQLAKVLDLEALKRLSILNVPGEKEFVIELIQDFIRLTPSKIEAIELGLRLGEFKVIIDAAHDLKSLAAAIGAKEVEMFSSKLEDSARLNLNQNLDEYFQSLKLAYDRLQRELLHIKKSS